MIIILKDLELVEETDEYLKFKVNDLNITKLITFLVDYGEREEFHLAELELLLISLNLLHSETQSKIRQNIDLINDAKEDLYERIDDGDEGIDDICQEWFGLEPDYLMELLD